VENSGNYAQIAVAELMMYGDEFTALEMNQLFIDAGIPRGVVENIMMLGYIRGKRRKNVSIRVYELTDKGREIMK